MQVKWHNLDGIKMVLKYLGSTSLGSSNVLLRFAS